MLVNDIVRIKINHKNYKYYKEKGYFLEIGEESDIYIKDLPIGSHIKVDIKCDKCNIEKNYIYQGYNKYTKNQTIPYYCNKCNVDRIKESFENKYGEGITNSMHINEYRIKQKQNLKKSITKEVLNKKILTNMEKYGSNVPSKNSEVKEKMKNSINSKSDIDKENIKLKRNLTNFNKYGFFYVNQNLSILKKSKNTRILNGNQIPDEDLSLFKIYRKKVTSFTNKNKKYLFKNWDGLDFYDNEYIKFNLTLDKYDKSYPTIDHKISVFNGFINNISPEEISQLENLCITKRTNNSKKNSNNILIL